MEPSDYLSALRRRSWVLVLAAVAAAAVTILVTPSDGERQRAQQRFSAEHTISLPPTAAVGDAEANATRNTQLAAAARLFRTPEIARRSAEVLERPNPERLREQVVIRSNKKLGTISFATRGRDRKELVVVADTFAEQAMAYQLELATQAYEEDVERVAGQLETLTGQLNEVDGQLKAAANDNASLKARRDALAAQLTAVAGRQADLSLKGPPQPRFVTLTEAKAVRMEAGDEGDDGFGPPESRRGRLVLAVTLAVVLGGAMVIVLDRFDSRLHDKQAAEHAFGLPVLAEVPAVARRDRRHWTVETAVNPLSPVAEAYRKLRSAIVLAQAVPRLRPVQQQPATVESESDAVDSPPQEPLYELRLEPLRDAAKDLKIILVTSAQPSEGRSTTVANLAVSLAEANRSVLIVDADLRHPDLDDYFDAQPASGLTDLVAGSAASPDLSSIATPTAHPRVRLVSSGTPADNPSRVLTGARRALLGARATADIVVVDTPPALLYNDAAELVPAADAVVVVARAGRTTASDAQQLSELLARLGAPVFGVALIGTMRRRRPALMPGRRVRRTAPLRVPTDTAGKRENGWDEPPADGSLWQTRSPDREGHGNGGRPADSQARSWIKRRRGQ